MRIHEILRLREPSYQSINFFLLRVPLLELVLCSVSRERGYYVYTDKLNEFDVQGTSLDFKKKVDLPFCLGRRDKLDKKIEAATLSNVGQRPNKR